jgi:hypothetical protein
VTLVWILICVLSLWQDFFGTKMLVSLPGNARDVTPSRTSSSTTTTSATDISSLLESLSTKSDTAPHGTLDLSSQIKVHSGGLLVPESSIMELKTRSFRAEFDCVDAYPQLTCHTRTSFASCEDIKLAQMQGEERMAQEGLRKLSEALETILELVRLG